MHWAAYFSYFIFEITSFQAFQYTYTDWVYETIANQLPNDRLVFGNRK